MTARPARARLTKSDWTRYGLPLASLAWLLPSLIEHLAAPDREVSMRLLRAIREVVTSHDPAPGPDVGLEISLAEGFKLASVARRDDQSTGDKPGWARRGACCATRGRGQVSRSCVRRWLWSRHVRRCHPKSWWRNVTPTRWYGRLPRLPGARCAMPATSRIPPPTLTTGHPQPPHATSGSTTSRPWRTADSSCPPMRTARRPADTAVISTASGAGTAGQIDPDRMVAMPTPDPVESLDHHLVAPHLQVRLVGIATLRSLRILHDRQ